MQLPSSSQTIKNNMLKDTIKLTPQESEQLSKYASDDAFVKTQKQDIESLASIYKELLNDQEMVEMIIILMFLEIILILQQDIRVHI